MSDSPDHGDIRRAVGTAAPTTPAQGPVVAHLIPPRLRRLASDSPRGTSVLVAVLLALGTQVAARPRIEGPEPSEPGAVQQANLYLPPTDKPRPVRLTDTAPAPDARRLPALGPRGIRPAAVLPAQLTQSSAPEAPEPPKLPRLTTLVPQPPG